MAPLFLNKPKPTHPLAVVSHDALKKAAGLPAKATIKSVKLTKTTVIIECELKP